MTQDDYFELLEEQHQFDVILHNSQRDAEVPCHDRDIGVIFNDEQHITCNRP